MIRYTYTIFLGLSLCACTGTPADTVTTSAPATSQSEMETMVAIDLSAYGSLVEIMVPNRSMHGVDPSVEVDDLSGYISIRAGKHFRIILREEPTTLEDIRQELENEMMWKNTITAYDPHSMIIERSLPDGSMAQHHFASVLPGVGGNVVLRSDPMGEFSEKDIHTMLASAMTLKTANGLAMAIK